MFLKNKSKNSTGFTLIELLVVISIIALLSSIVMSALNSARMKARDTKRIQDLKQIQIALELYKDDHGGKYPNVSCTSAWCTSNTGSWITLQNEIGSKYISSLPTDPINSGVWPFYITGPSSGYTYAYLTNNSCADGSCYDLVAQLEDVNNPYTCAVKNYYYNAGGVFWCATFSTFSPQIYSPQ